MLFRCCIFGSADPQMASAVIRWALSPTPRPFPVFSFGGGGGSSLSFEVAEAHGRRSAQR